MRFRVRNTLSWIDSGWIILAPKGQLTVFVGESHKGKSALVRRPWKWFAYGEPAGLDLLRDGASHMIFDIEDDDGTIYTRERTAGGVNRYVIIAPEQQPRKLPGSEVPMEIVEAFQLVTVTAGDAILRPGLSEQRDKSFEMSAPSRARLLNVLAGIEPVTKAIDALKLDEHRAEASKKGLEADLKENAEAQQALAWVEPFGVILEQLTALAAEIQTAEARRDKLAGLLAVRQTAEASLTQADATLIRLANLPQAMDALECAGTAATRASILAGLNARRISAATTLGQAEKDLIRLMAAPLAVDLLAEAEQAAQSAEAGRQKLQQVQRLQERRQMVAEAQKLSEFGMARTIDAEQVLAVLTEAEAVETRRAHLAQLATRRAEAVKEQEHLKDRLIVLEDELADVQGALADMEAEAAEVTCPKCGTKFTPEHLKEVA